MKKELTPKAKAYTTTRASFAKLVTLIAKAESLELKLEEGDTDWLWVQSFRQNWATRLAEA